MAIQKIWYLLLMATLLTACSSNSNQSLTQQQITALLLRGDSIASQAQSSLLKRVTAAMQKAGPHGAIDFCHIKATYLTDSVSRQYKTYIKRLSDKNRNPANAIQAEADSIAWLKIKAEKYILYSSIKMLIYITINQLYSQCPHACNATAVKLIYWSQLKKLSAKNTRTTLQQDIKWAI